MLRGWLESIGVSEEEAFDVTLACSEAFANAVGGPSALAASVVEVEAAVDATRSVTVVVRDFARDRPERSLEETRAFLRLMGSLMDSAETYARPSGATVVLRRRLRFAAAAPRGSSGLVRHPA